MNSSSRIIQGKAFFCGDFVNTDVMSPGRFEPYEGEEQLARIAMIDLDSPVPFVDPATGRSPYKIIVAGEEFGCGSSRETAPQALRYAGAEVVIARSFGRIFYRNCVNMGLLLPVKYPHPFDASITGQEITVDLDARTFSCGTQQFIFPDFGPLAKIVEAGGLINYTKLKLAEKR
jgi:3-isopropylmalate/(R)-2-methylmalate dehydratase small subunit